MRTGLALHQARLAAAGAFLSAIFASGCGLSATTATQSAQKPAHPARTPSHPHRTHPHRTHPHRTHSHRTTKTTRKRATASKKRQPEFPPNADQTKGFQYGQLSEDACFQELEQRGIRFRHETARGVREPVRLLGPVGGVTYRTDFPDAKRPTVPFEIFDCRLVLALADFGHVLTEHGIDEVRIFSAWRPPLKSWPEGKYAHAHPGGLAVDLRLFKKTSGEELSVEKDFHGRIGAIPCGPSATPPSPETPAARELRAILCSAADSRLFQVLLSPDFNRPHRNHFHIELRPNVRWFIVR